MTRWVMVRWLCAICAGCAGLGHAEFASAQSEQWGGEEAAGDDEKRASEKSPDADKADEAKADEVKEEGAALTPPAADAPADVEPEPESSQGAAKSGKLLGLRYRGIFIPKTVLNLFMDGGESVYVSGFGPEFSIRDDNVEYILSAWLAFYSMNPVAIKGSSDAEEAWEIVESNMKSVYLTADYLGHTRLARTLELSYGGGAGLGFLFGDLFRTQAQPLAGGTEGDPDDYVPCTVQMGSATDRYCDDINDHYNGYAEPGWFSGGSKPVVFPWLSGQVGLRYQPHEKVVTRLDLGIGTSGLYFGVGADYSL